MPVIAGWKSIARYLGQGVRTVQRWEHELALPVHHAKGAPRGPVVAQSEDLDAWISSRPYARSELTTLRERVAELEAEVARLRGELDEHASARSTTAA